MRFLATLVAVVVFLSAPLDAQDVQGFNDAVQELDPDRSVLLDTEAHGSLMYITVSDGWYGLPCYQRQRFAKSMRRLWRKFGGQNVILQDRAETTVAEFQVFGGDFDVRGCDG